MIKIIDNSVSDWKIHDFADFTILEVIILKSLLRHHEPIVRHALYQEVNQIVNPEIKHHSISIGLKDKLNAEQLLLQSLTPKKDLSTSSFYNSLNTLNKYRLLSFNLNNKGKIDSLIATPLARNALQIITGYFLQSIIEKYHIESTAISKCLEIIGKTEVHNLLYISNKIPIEQSQITPYQKITKDMSLFILEPPSEDITTKFKNISLTTFNRGIIREPNDIFEIVIIPEFQKDIEMPGIPKNDFVKEMIRITKPNGWIIVFTQTIIPEIDHSLANQVLQLYNQSQIKTGLVFSKLDLQKELDSVGLTDSKIIEFNGNLIAIHQVKK